MNIYLLAGLSGIIAFMMMFAQRGDAVISELTFEKWLKMHMIVRMLLAAMILGGVMMTVWVRR